MNYFEVKKISKKYKDHLALQGLSFKVAKGTIFGLLGHNGAGKSTLIRIILDIISSTTGEVFFNGKPLTKDQIRRFGYLPEERGLYKGMKVYEQLLYFAQLRGCPKAAADTNIIKWLDRFALREWQNTFVSDLSKGMQQKIQFINAIVHNPSFLILDEPFSGLDPVNSQLFVQVINELKAEGKTIIFSSHQMEAVEDLCDELIIINKGKIVVQGGVDELKERFSTPHYLVECSTSLQSNAHLEVTEKLNTNRYRIELKQPLKEVIGVLNSAHELKSIVKEAPSLADIFVKSFNLN